MGKAILREIPLSRVKWSDRSYCFRFDLQTGGLCRSIRKNGLLSPPGVILKGRYYQILFGSRRLAAARELHFRSITAAVYSGKIPGQQLVDLILADNHWPGTHPLDMAQFYRLVRQLTALADKGFLQRYAPVLAIPRSLKYLEFLKNIESFPARIKRAFYTGEFGADKAGALVMLKPADQLAVYRGIIQRGIEMSKSVFTQTVEILRDLKIRDRRSISRILGGRSMRPVLVNKKLTPQQKGARLLHNLRMLRYPRLSACLQDLDRVKKGLLTGLPGSVRLTVPPYLEENSITLTIQAGSEQELQEAINRIGDQLHIHHWQDLFRVVKGS